MLSQQKLILSPSRSKCLLINVLVKKWLFIDKKGSFVWYSEERCVLLHFGIQFSPLRLMLICLERFLLSMALCLFTFFAAVLTCARTFHFYISSYFFHHFLFLFVIIVDRKMEAMFYWRVTVKHWSFNFVILFNYVILLKSTKRS